MPSDPLPSFDAVDVALLATSTTHPRLAAISAELLAWWPTADGAIAAYNDAPPPSPGFDTFRGKAVRVRSAEPDSARLGDGADRP